MASVVKNAKLFVKAHMDAQGIDFLIKMYSSGLGYPHAGNVQYLGCSLKTARVHELLFGESEIWLVDDSFSTSARNTHILVLDFFQIFLGPPAKF